MRVLGQLCLLAAFVGSGYGAAACILGERTASRLLRRSGLIAAAASVLALTAVVLILARALWAKDFSFEYVAQYSSRLLPSHYSLSALWVGQAGSLLLWAWFLGILALVYRCRRGAEPIALRETAFGVLSLYICFLTAIMVFGADPMQPSIADRREGAGLSPLLQHPSMLVHPPVVFLGYAGWTIPFALGVAALIAGRFDTHWVQQARPWALFSWVVLGLGILLGAEWAYEELGWGGYWGWDPVENGSLIPWLTGTALVHSLMAWQYRGVLKKTALGLAIATFGLCNFATFLTRSGIFSSVHAFSQSPIGWMFLAFMAALAVAGGALIVLRRAALAPESRIASLWVRETFVLAAAVLLVLLAAVATVGTAVVPLSAIFVGKTIVVGPAFYNNVLIPTGLLLLLVTAAAPLLQWGRPPNPPQARLWWACGGVGAAVAAAAASVSGVRHPIGIAVAFLAGLAAAALVASLLHEAWRREPRAPWVAVPRVLRERRRQYVGFLIHIGFVCLAVGVTGSSLGSRRHEVSMDEGETIQWAGRSIRYDRLIRRELPDKRVAEAALEISRDGEAPVRLRPARHLHSLQNQWTTEVAIHSTWSGDFYTILNSGEASGRVSLTLVENPLMRWIWLGGWIMGAGALLALWPTRAHVPAKPDGLLHRRSSRPRRRELVASG